MDQDQIKQILRRLDSIEKTQKIQFEDRNILEDILLKIDASNREIAHLREEIKLLKDKVGNLEKNMRTDLKNMSSNMDTVKDSVDEVKEVVLDE